MTPPPFRLNSPQPLHHLLMLAAGQLIFWQNALKNVKDASAFLKPWFTDFLQKIENPPELDELYPLLKGKALTQATTFWRGVKKYQSYKTVIEPSEATPLWSRFSATLWDYGGDPEKPFFIIPSLINTSSILDLRPDISFVQALKRQGLRPLLLDWGIPGEAESHMRLEDYTSYILRPALAEVTHHYGSPHVMGYCMGGIMALHLTAMIPKAIEKLILLATPIHFKASGIALPEHVLHSLRTMTAGHKGLIPAEASPSVFWLKDPFFTIRKYQKFESMTDNLADMFVAVEDWVNNTIPLSKWVAETTLQDWYLDNKLAKNQWAFDLTKIKTPTLMITPERDSVVPPAASKILKDFIKVTEMPLPTGHVGLISNASIQSEYLPRIIKWLGQ